MTIKELAFALDKLRPRSSLLEGCYVLLSGLYEYDSGDVRKTVASCHGDLQEAERVLNRCFIVNDLLRFMEPCDWTSRELESLSPELVTIASVYADLVRAELVRSFPSCSFNVIVDGDHMAESEPLELLVTFCRAT